jgi:nitrous oxide reductase
MKQRQDGETRANPGRRRFLGGLAVAGTAAAVTVATGGGTADAAEPAVEQPEQGYRLSEHVKSYYKTAAM